MDREYIVSVRLYLQSPDHEKGNPEMKKTIQRGLGLVLSMMLLCGCVSAHGSTGYMTEAATMYTSNTGASAFYNTYWLMRSYTGNFYVVLYNDGTCFVQACGDEEMSHKGTWSYVNGKLTVDGFQFSKKASDGESWFVTADSAIGLYPDPSAAGFDVINVSFMGSNIPWTDVVPYINSDKRTMVPLRAVGEGLGLTVWWDREKQAAVFKGTAYYDDGVDRDGGLNGAPCEVTMSFPVGSKQATVIYKSMDSPSVQTRTKTVQMDTAAVKSNGRTFAPIRFLAETFGYGVTWNGEKRTVELTDAFIPYPFD